MKKHLSLALLFCSLTTLIAQTSFEKGSYIDNAGNRSEGFIKNLDWKDNPTSFEFSKTADGENSVSKTIQQVKSFEVTSVSLYERHRVNIDRASQVINDLGYNRNPEMKEETLFLKVMLDGKNKLYRYRDNKTLKLYYKKGAGDINALVYKRYLTPDQGLTSNNYYQQQLLNEFKCDSGKLPRPSSIQYTSGDILNFFQKYNTCSGVQNIEVDQREKRSTVQITAVAGMNANSYNVDAGSANIDFGSSTTPVFGIEIEYIMPFNNNKWSIFADTRFASFESEKIIESPIILGTQLPFQKVTLDYSSIDFSLGFRHYFFLSDTSKIFANLSYAIEVSAKSDIDFERVGDINANNPVGTYGLGIGYTYKDLRIEARYNGTKNHFGKDFGRGFSEYNSFMLTLGYSFAKF
jgi:hypothetical protein